MLLSVVPTELGYALWGRPTLKRPSGTIGEARVLVELRFQVIITKTINGSRSMSVCHRYTWLKRDANEIQTESRSMPAFLHFNNFLSRLLTMAGLALPDVSFITWPTKKPNNFSLPARYPATSLGLAAIIRSMTAWISPGSEI